MKKLIILIFILNLIFACQTEKQGQENVDDIDQSALPPPPKSYDRNNTIGFACYESGVMSNPVKSFSKILDNKDYNSLKSKLEKASPADKYLATFLCENLYERNLITLTLKELSQIDRNKNSEEFVTICSGCTNEDELTLKELFKSEENYLSDDLEEWLKEKIN